MPIKIKTQWQDLTATNLMVAAGEDERKFITLFRQELPDSLKLDPIPPKDYTISDILSLIHQTRRIEEAAWKKPSLFNSSGLALYNLANYMVDAETQAYSGCFPKEISPELCSFYHVMNSNIKDFIHGGISYTDILAWLYGRDSAASVGGWFIPAIYVIKALTERIKGSDMPDSNEVCTALKYLWIILSTLADVSNDS